MIHRLGARLSHWNDARATHDSRSQAPLSWRAIDRVAMRLYVAGER